MLTSRWPRLPRAFGGCARLLLTLLALEISGAVHTALDLVVAAGFMAHPGADCEQDGHECPPGCPSCHGACTAPAHQAPSLVFNEWFPPLVRAASPLRRDARAPSSPDRTRLDRPPRARVVLA